MIHVVVFVVIIEGLDGNVFHRALSQFIVMFAHGFFQQGFPFRFCVFRLGGKRHMGEIRIFCSHYSIIPFFFCKERRIL